MKEAVISTLLVLFILFNGYLLYKTLSHQRHITRLERRNNDLFLASQPKDLYVLVRYDVNLADKNGEFIGRCFTLEKGEMVWW